MTGFWVRIMLVCCVFSLSVCESMASPRVLAQQTENIKERDVFVRSGARKKPPATQHRCIFIPGPGIEACLQSAAAALQPYFQHLDDLVALAQDATVGANANVTSCVNKNQGNDDGLTDCLSAVRNQVFEGRDQLMAAILGVMADFRSGTGPLVADFTKCTNDVQDRALGESVDIIQTTRECLSGLGAGSSSRNSTSSA